MQADQTEIEAGLHRPIRKIKKRHRKLLVVVDGTPECKVAIRFAAARASHITGGGLIMFHCIRPGEFQHWLGVADRMREEALEEAQLMMDEMAERLHSYCGVTPEIAILEGEPKEQLMEFISGRNDIFGMVLGAGAEGDPGPLVDYFAHQKAGSLPCPVMLIPGSMTYDQVDEMA